MYTLDPRLRGLPASREQVVALHQSLNQPHVAIPGKRAGPASAFTLGLKGPSGLNVLVYLFLPDSADCAVYTSDRRNVSVQDYASLEGDALAFVESLGFMMDDLGFAALSSVEQEELMKSLPLFSRDPKSWTGAGSSPSSAAPAAKDAAMPRSSGPAPLLAWGRFLSTF